MSSGATQLLRMGVPAEAGNVVREAFVALGIRPFTPESVTAYQQAMCHKYRLRWWDKVARAIERRISLGVLCNECYGLSFVVMTVALASFTIGMWLRAPEIMIRSRWFVLGGSISTLLFAVLEKLADSWDYATREPGWCVIGPIEKCTQELGCPHCMVAMPLPVAYKARQLREHLPGATFFVEELMRETVLDPFLVVRHEGQEFHIAVWDEEGYEPKFDDAT